MNFDRTPNTVLAYRSTARTVICLLGFSGFSAFAQYAGCHHHTANDCLYKPLGRPKRLSSVARIHDAFVTRYTELHHKLKPFEARFVKEWINDWVKTIRNNIDEKVFVTKYVRLEDSEISPREARRRKQRDEQRRQKAVITLGYLK